MKTLPIGTLYNELTKEFERDPKGTRVAQLLAEYSLESDDWREFAYFEPECYTRNLLHRNEHFELLLLCWGVGQASPIHNHMGQNCWMTVLEGSIEEVHFRPHPEGMAGPLEQGNVRSFVPGGVAFITDDIALHLVRPLGGAPGVSLHLYSKPIDHCHIYCEQTGEVVLKTLGYHTVQGERTGYN